MEHGEKPVAIWVVNDLARGFEGCRAQWSVTTKAGTEATSGTAPVDLPADSRVRVADLSFPVDAAESYCVCLTVIGPDGKVLAWNRYDDAFRHLARLPGYPERMDHEIGMRLWNA